MMMLIITLPVAVSGQFIKADPEQQVDNIVNEVDRRLNDPPTGRDILGEDIILNVVEYDPDVLRAGTLKDQGTIVYARLSGTPTNPSIAIPKILDVDIISHDVVTDPPGVNVYVGNIAYVPPNDGVVSYNNMGYLAIPIGRLEKDYEVPDAITIQVETRVLFDVASGVGASPTKMVLPEEPYSVWTQNKEKGKYLGVYVHATEVGSSTATFDVYDDQSNEIVTGVELRRGQKSKPYRLQNAYARGQVFDQFTLYLQDIKNAGKTVDLLIVKDGRAQTQSVSEGGSIYPGSGIILERVDVQGEFIVAYFRGPNNQRRSATFPLKVFEKAGSLDLEDFKSTNSNPSGQGSTYDPFAPLTKPSILSSNQFCKPISKGKILVSDFIVAAADDIKNVENHEMLFKDIKSCWPKRPIYDKLGGQNMSQLEAKAIQGLLVDLEAEAAKPGKSDGFHDAVAHTLEEFTIEYKKVYPTESLSLGLLSLDKQAKEYYDRAIAEYGKVVTLAQGGTVVTPFGETIIPKFFAQYEKALLTHTKKQDLRASYDEYKLLGEILLSYENNPKQKKAAESLMSAREIENRMDMLSALVVNPDNSRVVNRIQMKENNGEYITIMVEGSSLENYGEDRIVSQAYIGIQPPSTQPMSFEKYQEGQELPLQIPAGNALRWTVHRVLDQAVIIKPSLPIYNEMRLEEDIDYQIPLSDKDATVQSQVVRLESVDLKKQAHVVVAPNLERGFSGANFNLHLPIEKRALDLPLFSDSIAEEINDTEELITKLDEILVKVEKVHNTWKQFCFGVYIAIAAWNFLKTAFGGSGARAKQDATEHFWNKNQAMCQENGLTLDECVFEHQEEYEAVLDRYEESYEYAGDEDEWNNDIKALVRGGDVNEMPREENVRELAKLQKYAALNPDDITAQKNYYTALLQEQERYDYDGLIEGKKVTSLNPEDLQKFRKDVYARSLKRFDDAKTKLKDSFTGDTLEGLQTHLKGLRIGRAVDLQPKQNIIYHKALTEITPVERKEFNKALIERELNPKDFTGVDFMHLPATGDPIYFKNNEIGAKSVFSRAGGDYTLTKEAISETLDHTEMATFYSDGPSEGKVHRITVDAERYAEVTYTTGGRISNIQVFTRLNPNDKIRADETERAGAYGGEFSAVRKKANEDKKNKLVQDLNMVEGCISKLNKEKVEGRDSVDCGAAVYDIAVDPLRAGKACTTFYSPAQCKLLFNACDPVLCPSSRCDLGGAWKVDNVIETGIIGGAVLCAPNFGSPANGGVIMPICITGIYAGLQNLQTVLMEYRDCLKSALAESESVGICDLIRSYYICDILWKEVVAIFNIKSGLIGEALKFFNGPDDGGEYSDFDASVDQSIGGLEYFTQSYAKNTFIQFAGGSLPEIGAEVCKAAIFGKVPGLGSFTDQLLRPESPPQFTALLDVAPYSDIPDTPRAEYQVYYRMYAGANEPVSFSVYLKYAGLDGQVNLPVLSLIQNQRLAADAFDANTINFQAPDGYNQVCVAYNSPTHGLREECGFGKVTSGFAVNWAARSFAKNQALEKGIQKADECVTSGSRFTSPNAGIVGNTGRILAGGISSGLLESGIVRVCSGVDPGDPGEWQIVGDCWEGDPGSSRNLGSCWLHVKSAEQIATKNYANQQLAIDSFRDDLGEVTQIALDDMAEEVEKWDIDLGYLTTEEVDAAKEKLNVLLNTIAISRAEYEEAVVIIQDIIDSPLLDKEIILEYRLLLAQTYKKFAEFLEKNLPSSGP